MQSKKRRPTLKDVAAASGVSVISASRALRGEPSMAEPLRRKVLDAARALGYRRNRAAGSLRGAVSELVAVLVPSISHQVFSELVDGIHAGLRGSDLRVVLGMTQYDANEEAQVLSDMLSWNPAAVVLSGVEHSARTRELLADFRGPIIEVMDTDGEPIDVAVGISQAEAGAIMARHFLARGYTNIGYIGAWGERPMRSRKRRQGFEAALAAAGQALTRVVIREEPSSLETGALGMAALRERHPDVDAVFLANDDLALGALYWCQEQGIGVPSEIALAGFNGLDMGRFVRPRLTTIHTSRHAMGAMTGEIIRYRCAEEPILYRQREKLALSLRVGETT
ncbi:LacI family DNA-binding transcriptional regulator [Salinicola sp. DM10]|uniref:LacI family DNA-binding transcriptional regulator n=1 Tax=Salinicola sp. DM10 TaxID=2815721 RepID=UPI001A8C50AA|nr:LacI family DNA-binding transcriptional regulator [Salinicola sp. DM10]MCE3026655.1 LacI family DNA-binding transcriptional regulator [Salinicola sp. DM10]